MISLLSLSSSYPISSTLNFPYRRLIPKSYIKSHLIISGSGQNRPKTLFPGGYRRPEIKTPTLILQLTPEEVLGERNIGERDGGERDEGERDEGERDGGERDVGERIGGERDGRERGGGVLDEVDRAVSGRVGIVVVGGERDRGGGRIYEAACVLKEVIRDRAYLMVSERVDIAEAVNATGVVLSDQGLPAIVARNTMMGSRSDSVLLPLVARRVSTLEAALSASNSEGADFLIYGVDGEKHKATPMNSMSEGVKIPIFSAFTSLELNTKLVEAEKLAKFGVGGFVVSLEELKLFTDEVMNNMFPTWRELNKNVNIKFQSAHELKSLSVGNGFPGKKTVAGFSKLEDRENQLVETEKSLMLEVINVVRGAVPLMEEVSLLVDAVSQLDEPFMLVIVGEFNSGKSTVINALLGKKYMKDGVVPTTNEITFLRYSDLESSEQQRCERHPDGQYICFLPSPILKEMIIVDTPGTNVILQRQQRLTEEFVPRADLLLFVISADRPLTESEVAFLRYTQQWKKRVVFVLNKVDLYRNSSELEEAIAFIKENTKKFLNTENVKLYPVAARAALEAKLSNSYDAQIGGEQLSTTGHQWRTQSFNDFENFLYSFLDGTTSTGIERIRLKLETPVAIAEQLLSACQKIVSESCEQAKRELKSVNELVESVKEYAMKMESESIPWKRQTLSLIDNTQARIFKVIESTLRVSNLNLVASYAFKEKSAPIPATSSVQYDIVSPALSDAQKLLREYLLWLQSSNAEEGMMYQESFEKRWSSVVGSQKMTQMVTNELLSMKYGHCVKVIENFSAAVASELFEQEIREVFLSTFGGLGAAGLSASLLTSVLPTTLEDLLALGLCSAGGLFSVSNFPARRQRMVDKVKRTANLLACELEEAMEKDLSEATENLENFVKLIGKPYQDLAQSRLDELLDTQRKLRDVEKKLEILKIEIQNLHVSL